MFLIHLKDLAYKSHLFENQMPLVVLFDENDNYLNQLVWESINTGSAIFFDSPKTTESNKKKKKRTIWSLCMFLIH